MTKPQRVPNLWGVVQTQMLPATGETKKSQTVMVLFERRRKKLNDEWSEWTPSRGQAKDLDRAAEYKAHWESDPNERVQVRNIRVYTSQNSIVRTNWTPVNLP